MDRVAIQATFSSENNYVFNVKEMIFFEHFYVHKLILKWAVLELLREDYRAVSVFGESLCFYYTRET